MAQLDPNIILQASNAYKPVDYATTLAQVGQIKAQRDQAQLQQVQLSRLARQDAVDQRALQMRQAAGAQFGAGDTSGAIATAGGAGDFELVKQLQSMNDDQRKRVFEISQHAAPILASISQAPPEAKVAVVQQSIPMLKEAGWQDPQIVELTQNANNPQWFKSKIAAAHTIAEFDAQANSNRTFGMEADKFAYQQGNDAANRGVTMRGQDMTAATARRGQNMTHADATAGDVSMLTPDAIESQAQSIAAGGDLPALGLGKTGARLKAQILNRAAEIQKSNGNDGAAMVLIKSARKANAAALQDLTKRNGVVSSAKNTAIANGDLLTQAAGTGAGTTGSPLVNRWQQAYRSGVQGSPDVAQFGLAINTFANEYAKVTSGATGVAGAAEGARQEMLKHLSEASTPQQIAAIVKQAKKEMASSTNALQGQIGETRKALSSGGRAAIAPNQPAANVIRYDAQGNRI